MFGFDKTSVRRPAVAGTFYPRDAEVLGEKDARDGISYAEERMNLAIQGQLRPGHLRGCK